MTGARLFFAAAFRGAIGFGTAAADLPGRLRRFKYAALRAAAAASARSFLASFRAFFAVLRASLKLCLACLRRFFARRAWSLAFPACSSAALALATSARVSTGFVCAGLTELGELVIFTL